MSEAANAQHFAQPASRIIASGYSVESWLHDGQAVGTGGIANPQPTRLLTGHYHYRFASSSARRTSQLGGGWWLDFENLNLVQRFAADNGYSLREAARLMLALPYAWTEVDLLVRALLIKPLRAWTGAGKPAQGANAGPDRGTRWIPTQHVVVRQLYVPGLAAPGEAAPLFEQVFRQPAEVTRLT